MRALETLKKMNEIHSTKEALLKQKNRELAERYSLKTYGEARHNGFGIDEDRESGFPREERLLVENEESVVYLSGVKKERLMQTCLSCGIPFTPSESGGDWQRCPNCRELQKVSAKKCPLCFIDHNPSLHDKENNEENNGV